MADFEVGRLRDCLYQLSEGKTTERKKQADTLKNYLEQPAIIHYLNKSSAVKKNGAVNPYDGSLLISWEIVFSKIKNYIVLECQQLKERESSENLSGIVRNNINKDKRKCLSLFRSYVKALSSNQQYDMAKPLMDHILVVLKDSFTRTSFGLEYTTMLLKYILSDLFMCRQISASILDDALWIYCKIIKRPPVGWDRNPITQVLFHILTVRLNMGTFEPSKLLTFFEEIFDSVRSEKACGHHENLLKCLLLMCENLCSDHRLRLCQLGESILPCIMQLWKTRPSEKCQELMLEFMSFQLALHNPKGVTSEESGARANDWSCWKNLLLNLYKLIVTEIMEICEKNKYSTNKETNLKPIFISVTVEVCAQVFLDSIGALDVTQSSFLNDSSVPSKKRRIEVCFQTLTDALHSSKIVPWLQVISAFLIRHSDGISVLEAEHLLDTLIDINLSCNQFETKNYLLHCFQSFVQTFSTRKVSEYLKPNFQWQRLWDIGVKSIALMNQCHEAAHNLLTSLLNNKLIIPKQEFHALYTPGSSNRVTLFSLRTLSAYLRNFHSSNSNAICTKNGQSYPEIQMLEWLFSKTVDDISVFQVLSEDIDVSAFEIFSQVTAYLCLQSNGSPKAWELDVEFHEEMTWINKMEEELLQITFDFPLKNTSVMKKINLQIQTTNSVIQPFLWEKILSYFIEASSNLFEEQTCNNQVCFTPTFIRYAWLLFEVLQTYYFQGVVENKDVMSNKFISYMKKFLLAATKLEIKKVKHVESNFALLFQKIIKRIVFVFQNNCFEPLKVGTSCSFILMVTEAVPIEVLKLLLTFSLESTINSNSSNSIDDFSEENNSNFSRKKNRYMIVEEDLNAETESFEQNVQIEDAAALLNLKNLPKCFQQQVQCLETLGEYCKFLNCDTHYQEANSFPTFVVAQLLPIVKDKSQNITRTADIFLVLSSLKCILLNKQLEDSVIGSALNALKSLLNEFGGMQDMCVSVLNLFPLFYPHLLNSTSAQQSKNTIRNKCHMFHLLKILCQNQLGNGASVLTSHLITRSIFEALKIEPTACWTSSVEKQLVNGESSNINDDAIVFTFSKFLNCQFSPVRLFVASNINSVIPSLAMETAYDFVSDQMFTFLKNQEQQRDDSINRVCTFLHYLSYTILQFPCCTKESLFMMCKILQMKKIDHSIVCKVVTQLASNIGYDSGKSFIETHLQCIFNMWIKEKFNLLEFPFIIIEADSYEYFLKNYFKILIPSLFFMEDMSSVSLIGEKLMLSISDLIYACLPSIQAKILSSISLDSSKMKAIKTKCLLAEVIPSEVNEKAFQARLDECFICLLSLLRDNKNSHLSKCQLNNAYSITFDELLATISHIMSNQDFSGSFIAFLNSKQDRIQNIFLSLSIKLSKAVTAHEEAQILFMYRSFLELLLPELNNCNNCKIFVIKEVIYTIINSLNEKKEKMTEYESCIVSYCDILYMLFKESILNFKEILGEFLPFMVSSLVSLVNETESGKKVLSLLSLLIIENGDNFSDSIPFMNPLPSMTSFEDLSQKLTCIKYRNGKLSLEQEIKMFLKSFQMMEKGTIEGLNHLCHQLKSQQAELLHMLNILKERTLFSEDVKTNILHQLVCQLSSLCASDDVSFQVKKAASNCLGAIGPITFSSVVMQPSSTLVDERLNAAYQGYSVILNLLIEYLFDKNIDVKKTASEVLKDLFGTKIGYSFFVEYKKNFSDNKNLAYATPFLPSQHVKSLKSNLQYELKLESIQNVLLWVPEEVGHSEWITTLVCSILESGLVKDVFYECLIPLCLKQFNFCDKILPHLIYAIVSNGDDLIRSTVSSGINDFFSSFSAWIQSISYKSSLSSSPMSDCKFSKQTVRTMLSVIHYIWLHPKQINRNSRNVLKDILLDINFLEVAQAAQYCSAYFTALLYTELWCNSMRERNRISETCNDHSDSSGSLEYSPLSYIGSQGKDKATLVYDILLDTYSNIGDSDAVSGCEVIASDSQAILKHSYFVDKNWDGLLKISDMNCSNLEVLQALQKNHLNSVLQNCIQSLNTNPDEIPPHVVEYQSEAAWRMGQWNLSIIESSNHGYQEYLYKSQQNLVVENYSMFEKYVELALKTQFEHLRHISLEATRNILPFLSRMQMLSVLEDFSHIQANPDALEDVLKRWRLQDSTPYDYFEFVEPVSWLKCILLKHQIDMNLDKQLQGRNLIISELKSLLENHAVRARKEYHLEVASRAVNTLRRLPCLDEEELLQWQMEEAKIVWTKKEYGIANKVLKSTLKYMEKFAKENPNFIMCYGEALTLRGRWLAETCSENSTVIMRDYLEKAVNVLSNINCENNKDYSSTICDAYLAVARFSDAQYQGIINYQKSTAYQTKQELMISSKEKAKQLRSGENTEDQRKLQLILVRQNEIDQTEMKTMEEDKKSFLEKAVTNYLKCLRGSDKHDLWIFRLISLWFQNLETENINQIIKDNISNLETYKFLPLMYQLAARMGTQTSGIFSNILMQLIKSIAVSHPHHALPVILALSNADKDPVEKKEISEQTVYLQQAEVPAVKERMNAAKKVLACLQKTKISFLLKSYVDLCDAYISLAYLPVEKKVKKGVIPSNQALLKFKNLENIPIITEEIKIDRTCKYENIVGIHHFHSEFRMCGGITLPKVIKCFGTDGVAREQLVKGRDDLRQDAVMQQVFFLVNYLLKHEMESQQRKLHIRTYKVVPVSRRSGVLQWCEGTQVLSQYLIAPHGAHMRYYPTMATPLECRKKMETIASVSQLPKKRQIFDSICANFPPVFRYFFLENFPEPSAWFERRQSYIKSVAASSIVGYILGLGDRHVNNILIDNRTAEVVHIDFGIAFEKGRILATPETVPFRLTRDIVDGMGINGVEGTFKRCSEKTLEVMRNSQDVLLTILEVLLHDPLYEWTVPTSKSSQKSSSSNCQTTHEVNTLAERALMRLQQKLQGLEEGVAMSIEGQVNLLIQQARDPNNLCRLYAGWQPYL